MVGKYNLYLNATGAAKTGILLWKEEFLQEFL
jgi:hypothetical protein